LTPPNDTPDIAALTVKGSFYSLFASLITITLGVIRFALLLYFLLPEDFGVFTQALFFVALTSQLRLPGLDLAIIQKNDIDESTRRTYFSLKIIFLLTSLCIMAILTGPISQTYPDMPLLEGILLALLGIELIKELNGVQESLLRRTITFRPIAIADVISSITMTIITPYLAWRGYGAWSLVAETVTGQLARGIVFWGFYRVWWPRFGWNRQVAANLWNFSARMWAHSFLNFFIDRFDDFWIGRSLGQTALGYYSRAYEAARYPRRIIAQPLLSVFYSTFSRLQADRAGLSRAFYRLMSLMVRISFGFSLFFIFTAPEIISFLGEKWEPMLLTFQLMIVYTLLDPLAAGAADLLISVGKPGLTVRVRFLQVLLFIPLVVGLSSRSGIEGVAIAADVMVLLGTFLLFYYTRRYVDYSSRRLWGWPLVGFVLASVMILAMGSVWQVMNPFLAVLGKMMIILVFYVGLLFFVERKEMKAYWQMLRPAISPILARLGI
jgi:teichuronic acid exporter